MVYPQGVRERTLTVCIFVLVNYYYTFTLADHEFLTFCLRASAKVMLMRNADWKPPITYPGYAPATLSTKNWDASGCLCRTVGNDKVNGGNSGQWVTPDSDSSCSKSADADTSAGKERCIRRWGSFPSGGGVCGGRFAARTVAVRSYPLSGVPPIYLTLMLIIGAWVV